jgi:hypothetical protein
VGVIPSHLSFRTVDTATLSDVAEQLTACLAAPGKVRVDGDEPRVRVTASLADLLSFVTGLVSKLEADAGQARAAMVCDTDAGTEDAHRRMEAYRAQRLLLEVTPVLLGFLLEACWGERGWPLEVEGGPMELRRLIRPGELERFEREGVDLGAWRTWDITTFCAVRGGPGGGRCAGAWRSAVTGARAVSSHRTRHMPPPPPPSHIRPSSPPPYSPS